LWTENVLGRVRSQVAHVPYDLLDDAFFVIPFIHFVFSRLENYPSATEVLDKIAPSAADSAAVLKWLYAAGVQHASSFFSSCYVQLCGC
jgi:hypothetical protein